MNTTDIDIDELEDDSFRMSRRPRDVVGMLVIVGFGLWVFTQYTSSYFISSAAMSGGFMLVGGISFLCRTPWKARRAGAFLALLGSTTAMFTTYTAAMRYHAVGYYAIPFPLAWLSVLGSLICICLSFYQICREL